MCAPIERINGWTSVKPFAIYEGYIVLYIEVLFTRGSWLVGRESLFST